jgi:SAM-dependent methyltransferase
VGCGLGYSILALEDKGLDVDGLEPDPKAAEVVNKSIKRGKCYAGFYDKFTSAKKYDVVWLSHTLEHVKDPIALLEKCHDITAENGILCLMVPDCTNPEIKKNSMENKYHVNHFTIDDIKTLVKKSKYEILEIQSFKRSNKWIIRFHKLLWLCKMSKIGFLLQPYFPLVKTDKNDGYELRAVLKKNNKN